MNRLHKIDRAMAAVQADNAPGEPVQRYLDALCAELEPILPKDRVKEVRMEAEAHLCSLIADHRAEGLSMEEAAEAALRSYGSPRNIGHSIGRACNSGVLTRLIWSRRATASIAAFCICLVMYTSGALLEAWQLFSSEDGFSHPTLLIPLSLLVVPTLAGVAAAVLDPRHGVRTLCRVGGLFLILAFINGFVKLPDLREIGIALLLAFVSLPISILTAWGFERRRSRPHWLHASA